MRGDKVKMKNPFNHMIENLIWQMPRRMRKAIIGDSILMRGTVTIRQGDKVMVFGAHNRIVSLGIKQLLQWLNNVASYSGTIYMASFAFNSSRVYSRMRIGTDVVTATTEGMSTLSNENTTDANSAGCVLSKVAAGQYRAAWTATWNTGVLAGIVCGEIGLYLTGIPPQADGAFPITNYSYPNSANTPNLFSRLSSASGDFVSFTIAAGVPFTVEWDLNVVF